MFHRPETPVRLSDSDETIEGPQVLIALDFVATMTTKDSYLASLRWRAGWLGYAWAWPAWRPRRSATSFIATAADSRRRRHASFWPASPGKSWKRMQRLSRLRPTGRFSGPTRCAL